MTLVTTEVTDACGCPGRSNTEPVGASPFGLLTRTVAYLRDAAGQSWWEFGLPPDMVRCPAT